MEQLDNFITITQGNISIPGFIINLLIAAFLAIILKFIYEKYGNSLSNRRQFGGNFLLLSMTTMLIISIVKSSLALSLGLVGALSIIRFRSAIKEPEELAYLFLAISIGLGTGANQTVITVIAFLIISILIILASTFSRKFYENQNLHLTIQSNNPHKVRIEQVIEILKRYCDVISLRRIDETKDILEVSFLIEARNFNQINKVKVDLQQLQDTIKFTFLDNKGVIS